MSLAFRPQPTAAPTIHATSSPSAPRAHRPVLVVVEGVHDVAFLKAIATVWRQVDPELPDLAHYERRRQIVFLPIGGGGARDIAAWATRLDALPWPRFHLHDRETQPETGRRLAALATIDRQPNRCARITSKRSLENYLHPAAIVAAGGPALALGDHVDVATSVAAARFRATAPQVRWRDLQRQAQRRLVGRTKRWLNTVVVGRMTPPWAAVRDPAGEVAGWLREIDELVHW